MAGRRHASGWVIFASAFAYLLLLFAVASYGDRRSQSARLPARAGRWSMRSALRSTAPPGPISAASGLPPARPGIHRHLYRPDPGLHPRPAGASAASSQLAKAEKLTSVADFIAARYGKNPAVATIVALISLVGAIPYIALQLKAVSSSVSAMVDTSGLWHRQRQALFHRPAAARDAVARLFRHHLRHAPYGRHRAPGRTDPRRSPWNRWSSWWHRDGRPLRRLLPVRRPGDLWAKALANNQVHDGAATTRRRSAAGSLLVVLSAFAIIMLPRQFHVTVVENRTDEGTAARRLSSSRSISSPSISSCCRWPSPG